MNAAHDPCSAAFLAGVAQCQPASMRFLLRGLKAQGYSAGQVRHAASRLVATGAVRVVSKGKPFVYALPAPDAPPAPRLVLGPSDLPLTQQVLHTLEHVGKTGATYGALSDAYAARAPAAGAVRFALAELYRTHRVTRRGERGQYVYVFAFASVPTPRALGLVEGEPAATAPALAPAWPAPEPSRCPQGVLSVGSAPAWRIAA